MRLSPGSRLGVYDVIGLIGTGGMGEVYRARDPRLSRDVAIKVLPESVSSDHGRIAQFERESRALAALSHPNIGVIHGLEEIPASGPGDVPANALILELVEGETLADRLERGPLPLEEALAIAEQIADALESAHEKGIIHRDLKPSNVKITPGGVVKVLDFGLAKIVADAAHDVATMTIRDSETVTGVIMGTPAYMAPEQAQGRPLDKRVDVWAFGVLLYEMLAGDRPFRGASFHETLAAILTTEPDWDRIPRRVQPLLRRCLERDPRRRLRDVGDFRFLIEQSGAERPAAPASRLRWLALSGIVTAAVLTLAVWGWSRTRASIPDGPVRLTTMLPAGVSVVRGPGIGSSVAVSPDGRTLVVAGTGKEGQRLFRRPLDQLEATPLAGTERGSSPFFSWDGEWIGFFADGRLKRVPAEGGAAVDIVAVPEFPAGASWGPDDRIVFAYGAAAKLHSVDARGGNAEVLTAVESGLHPEVLPDGRTVLFESGGWIHALDRSNGRHTRLVRGSTPRYAIGQVIVTQGTTLMAVPVDVSRHEVIGPAIPLVEGVAFEPAGLGIRHYAVSRSGTMAYVPAADAYALVLVEPDGTERLVIDEQRGFENPRFSPDGQRIVVATNRREGERPDLWVHDLKEGGSGTRLTFDGGRAPVWAPDGSTITYSHQGERRGIYAKRADGRGDAKQLLILDTTFHWLVGWTPDQRTLAYGHIEGNSGSIMALSDGQRRRVVGPGSTWGGRLSSDGRWLAYYLLESGTFEVYVTPFPESGTRWLIADGTDPNWAPDGTEVYYRSGARLMAARIDKTSGIRVLSHRVVVEPFLPPLYDDYDIHPDGRTLVMVRPARVTQGREVTVIVNWLTELRRLVGTS